MRKKIVNEGEIGNKRRKWQYKKKPMKEKTVNEGKNAIDENKAVKGEEEHVKKGGRKR